MSVLWTAAAAAEATGGTVASDWEATGISIDSRSVAEGDLFVALKAARDGHEFVADALAKGAAAALVSHVPEGVSPERLLVVDEVMAGLERLGRAGRARCKATVIAVTGSVGKTTVKEMLRTALSGQGRVHAAEASFNNHWGVPVTLARMPVDTEFAIIEIGMNAPGEIAPLARMAQPHIAIVTTVAPAHLEAFGVIEGIAEEKSDIFEGLAPGGIALAHADIATAPILYAKAEAMGARLIRFGMADEAEVRLTDLRLTDGATVMKVDLHGVEHLVKLAVPGRHLAMNAVIALAATQAAGADPVRAMMALSNWQPYDGRGARERIVLSAADDLAVELIDDAFNANPASIAAGLDVLAAAQPVGRGRRVAVLGDMLELGADAPALHAEIAELSSMGQVDIVHTLGPLMVHLHDALPPGRRGSHAEDPTELARAVASDLRPGDVVLVKGSKGIKASRVVDALRKLGQAAVEQSQGPR